MTQGIETRLDDETLVVRIPMRFKRRGGRKRIVAANGSAIVPSSKPQPDGTLVKALARAWRWQELLDEGVYASVSEIGDAENISKSYVSWTIRACSAGNSSFQNVAKSTSNAVTSRSAISSSPSRFAAAQVRAISSGAPSSLWTWSSTGPSTSAAGTLITGGTGGARYGLRRRARIANPRWPRDLNGGPTLAARP
jgi:hypothetical protein